MVASENPESSGAKERSRQDQRVTNSRNRDIWRLCCDIDWLNVCPYQSDVLYGFDVVDDVLFGAPDQANR